MTPEQQQAACRDVAEARGYTVKKYDLNENVYHLYSSPERCCPVPATGRWYGRTEEEAWTGAPNLFAATPDGAAAREEAEAWLLSKGWETDWIGFHLDGKIYLKIESIDCPEGVQGYGATLAEARAAAIVAAVRAMKEASNGER